MGQLTFDKQIRCTEEALQSFRETLLLLGVTPDAMMKDPPLLRQQDFRKGWVVSTQLQYPDIHNPRIYIPLFQACEEPVALMGYGGHARLWNRVGRDVLCDVLVQKDRKGNCNAFLSYAPHSFESGNNLLITTDLHQYLKGLYYFYCQCRHTTSVLLAGDIYLALQLLRTYPWKGSILWNDIHKDLPKNLLTDAFQVKRVLPWNPENFKKERG